MDKKILKKNFLYAIILFIIFSGFTLNNRAKVSAFASSNIETYDENETSKNFFESEFLQTLLDMFKPVYELISFLFICIISFVGLFLSLLLAFPIAVFKAFSGNIIFKFIFLNQLYLLKEYIKSRKQKETEEMYPDNGLPHKMVSSINISDGMKYKSDSEDDEYSIYNPKPKSESPIISLLNLISPFHPLLVIFSIMPLVVLYEVDRRLFTIVTGVIVLISYLLKGKVHSSWDDKQNIAPPDNQFNSLDASNLNSRDTFFDSDEIQSDFLTSSKNLTESRFDFSTIPLDSEDAFPNLKKSAEEKCTEDLEVYWESESSWECDEDSVHESENKIVFIFFIIFRIFCFGIFVTMIALLYPICGIPIIFLALILVALFIVMGVGMK